MPRMKDLTGHKFGRLIALSPYSTLDGHVTWTCKCDCGNTVIVSSNDLCQRKTSSCGCLRIERAIKQAPKAGRERGKQLITHGKSHTRLYTIWKSMRQRCNNPRDKFYQDYGGRGIKVCFEWNNYQKFYEWAVNNGYNENAKFGECTIDRIDNNNGYFPNNCRWVDLTAQANNRRRKSS